MPRIEGTSTRSDIVVQYFEQQRIPLPISDDGLVPSPYMIASVMHEEPGRMAKGIKQLRKEGLLPQAEVEKSRRRFTVGHSMSRGGKWLELEPLADIFGPKEVYILFEEQVGKEETRLRWLSVRNVKNIIQKHRRAGHIGRRTPEETKSLIMSVHESDEEIRGRMRAFMAFRESLDEDFDLRRYRRLELFGLLADKQQRGEFLIGKKVEVEPIGVEPKVVSVPDRSIKPKDSVSRVRRRRPAEPSVATIVLKEPSGVVGEVITADPLVVEDSEILTKLQLEITKALNQKGLNLPDSRDGLEALQTFLVAKEEEARGMPEKFEEFTSRDDLPEDVTAEHYRAIAAYVKRKVELG